VGIVVNQIPSAQMLAVASAYGFRNGFARTPIAVCNNQQESCPELGNKMSPSTLIPQSAAAKPRKKQFAPQQTHGLMPHGHRKRPEPPR
jgi:hypothetical protein